MQQSRRYGAVVAQPSFKDHHAKLANELKATLRRIKRTQAMVHCIEASQRRTGKREWVTKRRERTRHLIELGGLVQKAGLVELTDDDRAIMLGAFLRLAEILR